jgi:hypothetical protein
MGGQEEPRILAGVDGRQREVVMRTTGVPAQRRLGRMRAGRATAVFGASFQVPFDVAQHREDGVSVIDDCSSE